MTKKILKLINNYNKDKRTKNILYIKTFTNGSGRVFDNRECDSFMFYFKDTKDLENKLSDFYCG
tara:strand:- start:276 stop:467 length:192 start_codon:yes stop_codon:yes gene_type:complete